MSRPMQPSSLALRGIDLLQGLSVERLDAISRQCAWRHFDACQALIARGQGDRDLHLIAAGAVRVTIHSSGGREGGGRQGGEQAGSQGDPRCCSRNGPSTSACCCG